MSIEQVSTQQPQRIKYSCSGSQALSHAYSESALKTTMHKYQDCCPIKCYIFQFMSVRVPRNNNRSCYRLHDFFLRWCFRSELRFWLCTCSFVNTIQNVWLVTWDKDLKIEVFAFHSDVKACFQSIYLTLSKHQLSLQILFWRIRPSNQPTQGYSLCNSWEVPEFQPVAQ